jgi:hypothetical protein
MKRAVRRALLAALSLLAVSVSVAPAATLRVELEPTEATVGDRVRATLVLEAEPGELAGEPRFPAWGKTWGEAEIVEAGAPQHSDAAGGVVVRQTLTLAAFRPGDLALPATAVVLPGGGEVATPNDLALRVRSVLPAGEAEPQPKPPLPPRALPWGNRFWWTLAGGLALCLALAAILLWRRRRAGASERGQEAALSPLDELLARLAKIEQAGEPLERTHTALSLALRRYLGRTLDFPAAESTTSEIQRQLRGRHLPGDIAQRATRLLRDCDGIKFARGETTPAELALRLAAAREMATAIDQYLNPAPAPLQATA